MLLTFLFCFAIFLLLVVIYFLFAPLRLEIDTNLHLYRFSVVPIFSIRWVTDAIPHYAELRIFGFRKKIERWEKPASKQEVVVVEEKSKRKPVSLNFKKIKAVLHSFRVKKWFINIDTGDMALNGKLFPWLFTLSFITKRTFRINFIGKTEVFISIQNNAFRMMKAYLYN